MKYIKVPSEPVDMVAIDGRPVVELVKVNDQETTRQVKNTFEQFIMGRLSDPAIGGDMAAVLTVMNLRDGVKEAAANGGVWAIQDDKDYAALLRATEHPKNPYNPALAGSLVPFMLAVKQASDTPPKD